MTTKPIPVEPDYIACKTCLEELPDSVSKSQEADQYAQHFCGIECYSIWKSQSESKAETGK